MSLRYITVWGVKYKTQPGTKEQCPCPCRVAPGPSGHLWRGWMGRTVPQAATHRSALPLKHLAQAGPRAGCSLRTRPNTCLRARGPGGHAAKTRHCILSLELVSSLMKTSPSSMVRDCGFPGWWYRPGFLLRSAFSELQARSQA